MEEKEEIIQEELSFEYGIDFEKMDYELFLDTQKDFVICVSQVAKAIYGKESSINIHFHSADPGCFHVKIKTILKKAPQLIKQTTSIMKGLKSIFTPTTNNYYNINITGDNNNAHINDVESLKLAMKKKEDLLFKIDQDGSNIDYIDISDENKKENVISIPKEEYKEYYSHKTYALNKNIQLEDYDYHSQQEILMDEFKLRVHKRGKCTLKIFFQSKWQRACILDNDFIQPEKHNIKDKMIVDLRVKKHYNETLDVYEIKKETSYEIIRVIQYIPYE